MLMILLTIILLAEAAGKLFELVKSVSETFEYVACNVPFSPQVVISCESYFTHIVSSFLAFIRIRKYSFGFKM